MIACTCPSCRETVEIHPAAAGKRTSCPACGAAMIVPSAPVPQAPAPPPAPPAPPAWADGLGQDEGEERFRRRRAVQLDPWFFLIFEVLSWATALLVEIGLSLRTFIALNAGDERVVVLVLVLWAAETAGVLLVLTAALIFVDMARSLRWLRRGR